MSFFKDWKFRTIAVIVLLSLAMIIFGPDFKKGIDVAGWVELTYQIDFSKYREAYRNDTDFNTAVQNAKQIIKTNLSKRVNSMGVGDAEVKLLKVGEKEYIVVKVWGLTDVEVAKATIGKTVELEFKLPNEWDATPEELAARQKLAEDLLVTISAQPDQMSQLTANRQSDDVYYDVITKTFDQLPPVYQDNAEAIKWLSGVANQIFQGIYSQQPDLSGNLVTIEWFFIVKNKGSRTIPSTTIDESKLTSIDSEFATTTTTSYQLNSTATGQTIATGILLAGEDLVISQSVYPSAIAYRATAYLISGSSAINPNTEVIDIITDSLLAGELPASDSNYSLILDNEWIDLVSLQDLETGFMINSGEQIKLVNTPSGTVVIKISETKSAFDILDRVNTIAASNPANRDAIIAALTTQTLYDIEQVFIRDRSSRVPAIEKKLNRVLNGAYFQSASTTQGQAGLPVVTITFNKEGADIFCNLTAESVGKQMAIFVGWQLVTNPIIRDKICGGQAQIDGQFLDQTCTDPKDPTKTFQATTTAQWASCLVSSLNEGALPAPLALSNQSTVAPTLGDNAWVKAGYATLVGLLLVFWLLWYMYGIVKASLVIISLILYLIVLLAFVKLTDYALSLSGIAAIILNIGMWVDSSILILERLKEERQHGAKLIPAILTAYDRSRAPILDGNVSTGLIGFMMALVWSDIFQGFGFMMVVNIIILLCVWVPMTKFLLLRWAESKHNNTH